MGRHPNSHSPPPQHPPHPTPPPVLTQLLQLPHILLVQVQDKAVKLAALRASVMQAGRDIPVSRQQLLLDEAVEQFRRNNAVVAEFSLGWRPVLRAVPVYVYVLLLAVGVVAAMTLAGATFAWV